MVQRDDIAQELTTVINRAQSMLSSLGEGTAQIQRQAKTAVKTAKKAAKKARRTMSAAALGGQDTGAGVGGNTSK
ncbi:MAG: hypothetical protein Q8O42_17225 [Acidobacteriota bacterium]|nr:hypothetical protein [Acidobacteriota bacterium]